MATAQKRSATTGQLRERVHLQKWAVTTDEFGNEIGGGFVTQFTAAARLRPLRGTETVMQSRLTGTQPYVATIRSSAAARQVTTDWQVVDARNSARVFNITSITNPDERNQYLDLLIVQGERS